MIVTVRTLPTAAVLAALVLGGGASVFAQQQTYEGDIVALDGKANTFTVKGTKPGESMEMAFHVGKYSDIVIEGQRRLFGELVKGDRVLVTYGTTGSVHTVQRAERTRSVVHEMTFAGDVTAVDLKAQTFTVKAAAHGKIEEMQFHVDPATRLYLGGEDVFLMQLRTGESVIVAYEMAGTQTHYAKHLKKSA
jgi:hypothetical protein